MPFGYVGGKAATQNKATGNSGVFEVNDIAYLLDTEQFTLQAVPDVQWFAIAGGGGGGAAVHGDSHTRGGGGGGAGGMHDSETYILYNGGSAVGGLDLSRALFEVGTSYAVSIGAGGNAGTGGGAGGKGGSTTINDETNGTVTLNGGGLGNGYWGSGGSGGCGGGAGSRGAGGGSATPAGQGNNGGGSPDGYQIGGGGGGRASAGSGSTRGNGINPVSSVFANGVGYGGYGGSGSGGGGSAGATNSGNGGNGGNGQSNGGAGGSGRVALYYPSGFTMSSDGTLSSSTTDNGDGTKTTYINSGSGNISFS